MKRISTLALLSSVILALSLTAQSPPDAAKERRLRWFRDAKFGLFIHWGLYAVPAGEWKGKPVPGIGEWIMNRAQIPVREYEQLAAQFNPVKFDADAWVKVAKDAGMRYIVITSKHHDGFALFHSKVSKYTVADATPFKRDILKELSAACARQGMRLGFYYSQAQDWHEPNGAGNTWDFGPDEKKDYDKYLREKAEPQVREILTGYGPVCLIWFDTPRMMTPERSQRFVDIVRQIQPECLIDGRLGLGGKEGDYRSTGDNAIPDQGSEEAWETPATINHTWGYKKDDRDWKRPGEILFKLLDITSKRDSRTQRGDPARGREVARGPRRSRLRHRTHAVRRGARRLPRGSEGPQGGARLGDPLRLALHHQTRQALLHRLQLAADGIRPAALQEQDQDGVPARGPREETDPDGGRRGRRHHAPDHAAGTPPDRQRHRRGDRGGPGAALNGNSRSEPIGAVPRSGRSASRDEGGAKSPGMPRQT
jgi:hypothetical protein